MNILNLVSKALGEQSATPSKETAVNPTASTHAELRKLATTPCRPAGHLSYVVPRSRFGARPEIFAIIAAALKVDATISKQLKAIEVEQKRIFGEVQASAEFGSHSRETRHLADLSRKLLSGATVESLEGFSSPEFDAERTAQIRAGKLALAELSRQAFKLLKPIFVDAAIEAERLLDAELATDIARNAKFGIPTTEPSEIVRSINEVLLRLKSAAAAPEPSGYAPVRDMARELVKF